MYAGSLSLVFTLTGSNYYGTIIQGSPIPFNDLSRGCPLIEIVRLTGVTLMQLKWSEKNI